MVGIVGRLIEIGLTDLPRFDTLGSDGPVAYVPLCTLRHHATPSTGPTGRRRTPPLVAAPRVKKVVHVK